jgi:hypothetical protein
MTGTVEATSETVTMRIDRDIRDELAEAAERLHLQGPGVLANVLLAQIGNASLMVDRYLEIVGR